MARAIVTPEKIRKFLEITPTLMQRLTLEANEKGAFFWADVTQSYSQVFDVDSDKKLGGRIGADAPALDGVVDAEAELGAGLSIEKSREGELSTRQVLRFRSEKALAVDG